MNNNNLLPVNQDILSLKSPQNHDIIIVGAGIFGAVLAYAMAKQGWDVLLIERDFSEPNRISGELLLPGGKLALQELNLEHCLENIGAMAIEGTALFYQNEHVQFPFPKCPETSKTYLGRAFHHGPFVSNLRSAALQTKGVTGLEATVNKLIIDPSLDRILGISCQPKAEEGPIQYHFAPLTVVADGCFSKFRKTCIPSTPKILSHFVAFIIKDCPLPFPNHAHSVLTENGPIIFYEITASETRVMIDISGKLPNSSNGDLKEYLLTKIMPTLPECIWESFTKAVLEEKPRIMPNTMLGPSRHRFEGGGLLVGGDALNMRHALTGGGMTIALWDAIRISKLLSKSAELPCLTDHHLVNTKINQFHIGRKSSSTVINILSCTLYNLFQVKDDIYAQSLQEGCFKYFQLGGNCVHGFIKVLAGVDNSFLAFLNHFGGIFLYAQYLELKKATVTTLPAAIILNFKTFLTGLRIFLPITYSEVYDLVPAKFSWNSRPQPLYVLYFMMFVLLQFWLLVTLAAAFRF